MPREQRSQQVSPREPDMADEERGMVVGERHVTYELDDPKYDSILVITLYHGEREPHVACVKAGRMTGQMVMGLEGAGMMKIDNVLRAAQQEMRRKAGQMAKQNMRSIEDRLMQTKENSGV
jgi:hypothetical protein